MLHYCIITILEIHRNAVQRKILLVWTQAPRAILIDCEAKLAVVTVNAKGIEMRNDSSCSGLKLSSTAPSPSPAWEIHGNPRIVPHTSTYHKHPQTIRHTPRGKMMSSCSDSTTPRCLCAPAKPLPLQRNSVPVSVSERQSGTVHKDTTTYKNTLFFCKFHCVQERKESVLQLESRSIEDVHRQKFLTLFRKLYI